MNGYAISFDMQIELLEQFYGIPYNPAYAEIRKVLMDNDFYWIQGSTYVTQEWSDFTSSFKKIK